MHHARCRLRLGCDCQTPWLLFSKGSPLSLQVGEFGADNRAGINKTLHRISAIRNRAGKVVGLTCRVSCCWRCCCCCCCCCCCILRLLLLLLLLLLLAVVLMHGCGCALLSAAWAARPATHAAADGTPCKPQYAQLAAEKLPAALPSAHVTPQSCLLPLTSSLLLLQACLLPCHPITVVQVGRAIEGSAAMAADLAKAGRSLLLLGAPTVLSFYILSARL